MDFAEQSEVSQSLRVVHGLLSSGIFHPQNAGHVFFRSAFIDSLISLRALMYKSERYAKRISFNDDVLVADKVKDVTDLIKYVRDAVCHPDSDNHKIEGGSIATFNVIFGKGCLMQIGDFRQESIYEDDIYFTFGGQGIYLKRHIIRAYKEAKENLMPLIDEWQRPRDL
ncbi:hypothetical protein [Pseudomonas sp. GM48]|uniref:hypothetical protein n=1 Tax=Pseudomonas sp. GM48 TaxID=1144330 RepID=UPI0002700003|nr:hypothetical protein [Pseudomonas sp. GM48]EJM48120.1 hypothetical protein PMI28_05696 [Pseudomonas sp. GM48]